MKNKKIVKNIKDFQKKQIYWQWRILFLVVFLVTFIFYPHPYCLKVTGMGTNLYCFQGLSIIQGIMEGAGYNTLGFFLFSIEGIISLIKISIFSIFTLWFYNKLSFYMFKKGTFIKNKKLLNIFVLFISWGISILILFLINKLTAPPPIVKFID